MIRTNFSALLLLFVVCCLPLEARRTRRRNTISNALQDPIALDAIGTTPVLKQSFDLAAAERLSENFIEDPIKQAEKEEERIKMGSIPDAQEPTTHKYELPKELQQKAQVALEQVEKKEEEPEKIEFQFEDADLQVFIQQISELFDITFISDEIFEPLPKGTPEQPVKALKGNKISFKTNKPLNREQAWNLFITFMDIAGFAIVQQPESRIYRIQTIKAAHRAPLPTFIGIDSENLPDNDDLVRYLYFIENTSIQALKGLIPSLISSDAASPVFLQEQKAILLTDKSYNIKALMKIIKELDKVTMPQAMSVLKLRQADAIEVKKLYDELTQSDDKSTFRPFGAKKQPTSIYFPENARIIAEPRTNSLILLGPKDALEKIEDFVVKFIDVALDQPYSPLFTYQLQYADSKTVADIMNNTTKFKAGSQAAKAGGVRGSDKFMKDMFFTPEPSTNKLIIKGDYEDYLIAKKVIAALDEPQPQVAIEVLILTVDLIDDKEVGTQLRSKMLTQTIPALKDLLGLNTVFQTSGLRAGGSAQGIQTNSEGSGFQRLLGNLLSLVTNAPAGNTILTFGQDLFGVWGLFQVLRTITNLQVVSNPFLVASNQTPAKVSIGEQRRVVSEDVFTQTVASSTPTTQGFENDEAVLQVQIRPQINSDGMIVLNLDVDIQQFTNANPQDGNKTKRKLKTQAVLADREVLALGGLIRNETAESLSKTPVLGDIPVVGWLFKNRSKTDRKSSLLILMSTKIISPNSLDEVNGFTQERVKTYRSGLDMVSQGSEKIDPIHRLFFADKVKDTESVGEFIFERREKNRKRRKRSRKNKDKDTQTVQQTISVEPEKPQPTAVTIAAPGMMENKQPTPKEEVAQTTPLKSKIKTKNNHSITHFLQDEKVI